MHNQVFGFDIFQELYATDPLFAPLLKDIVVEFYSDSHLHEGFLFKVINYMFLTRLKIVAELYYDRHMGCDKTLILIINTYFLLL